MNNLKKYIKAEMENEFLACVHAMSMVFVYGLELYVYGIKSMQYAVIFQMFILGYVIALVQRLLFIKDKVYAGMDYNIRAMLWSVLPVAITGIVGIFLNWYREYPDIIWVIFLIIMLIYYGMVWVALQIFYKEDTDELNEKLNELKKHNSREEVE